MNDETELSSTAPAAPADAGAAPPPAPVRGARWRRILLGTVVTLAVFLAVLGIFMRYALPGIVRGQAERVAGETLHRRLLVEQVQIHPLTLDVALQGVRLMEPDGRTVFASFDRLEARLSYASLLHLAPVLRQVHLVAPYIHLTRTAAHAYSTDDILAALEAQARARPAPPTSGLPRFAVHNIRVDDGRFIFDDLPQRAHHEVSGFTLGLPLLSTFAAEEEVFVEPLVRAVVDGAPLRLDGRSLPFAPVPQAQLDLGCDSLDLTRLAEYLPASVHLNSARLAAKLHLVAQLPKGQAPRLEASGTVGIQALDVATAQTRGPLRIAALDLQVARLQWPAGQVDATLGVQTKAGQGSVAVAGGFGVAPLHADLSWTIRSLDLLPLQPFFADRVNLRVTRAALAGQGRLILDQDGDGSLRGALQGDLSLPKLATIDLVNANDFVSWDGLTLQGLDLQLQPLSIKLQQVALDNLYARVIIDPKGRFNLQQIVRGRGEARRSLTEAAAEAPAAQGSVAPAPQAEAKAAVAKPPAAPPLPPIRIGQVLVRGGHVRFSDNFVQPRYSADLMDLHGSVTGLSSQAGTAAQVDLKGKVNDAPLVIAGTINPLLANPALAIRGSVHDMELAGLSPYSGKYVGYRIERGKLSFEADYRLENRQLQAENHLVLDQLTFGERVDSPSATTLPVQLAVALLKDRNGVIDIHLPIGGSLDDPQFSIGSVLVQVLVNLVTKAVTAPFALLGRLFGGGGEELSAVDFPAGQATVPAAAEPRLQALAKALTERPGLQLDISGRADRDADRNALSQAKLDAALRTLKRKDLAARGALVSSAEVTVTPADYPTWLAQAYAAEVALAPDPARGDAKTPPTIAQMEDLLRRRQIVTEDDLRALGNRRAQATKDWFVAQGAIAIERLSLVAAKVGENREGSSGSGVVFDLH